MRERTRLDASVSAVRKIESNLSDTIEILALAEAEGDNDMVAEAEAALNSMKEEAEKRQLESLLSGEVDANDAYLEINPGAGGTESQDWAEILLRMYMRWAERRGYKVSVQNRQDGEEAGIKSATIRISGEMAYGWSKTWSIGFGINGTFAGT